MVYRPRVILEILKDGVVGSNGFGEIVPVFQLTIDNVIGITADWISAQIVNTDNKYDWIFDNIDHHEMRVYQYMSELPVNAPDEQILKEAQGNCIFWGWFGPTSKTIGSQIQNIISIKGGDVAYMLNKRHPGDYVARDTDVEKAKTKAKISPKKKIMEKSASNNNPFPTNSPIGVINFLLKNNKDGIKVIASNSFKDPKLQVYGFVQEDQYSPDTLSNTEQNAARKKRLYQSNNSSILEIIDDICVKTGYEATVIPGTKDVMIYLESERISMMKHHDTLNVEYVNYSIPLDIYTTKENKNARHLNTCMYCKIAKYPGYEDGLELNMIHWDWENSNGQGLVDSNYKTATAKFIGNEDNDAFASVTKIYEKIPQEALNKKVARSLSRIVSNRITGYIGLPAGDSAVLPGKRFKLHGAGFFSGTNASHKYLENAIYLITSTKRNFSASGHTMSLSFRLADLEVSKTPEKNPYTTYKLGVA